MLEVIASAVANGKSISLQKKVAENPHKSVLYISLENTETGVLRKVSTLSRFVGRTKFRFPRKKKKEIVKRVGKDIFKRNVRFYTRKNLIVKSFPGTLELDQLKIYIDIAMNVYQIDEIIIDPINFIIAGDNVFESNGNVMDYLHELSKSVDVTVSTQLNRNSYGLSQDDISVTRSMDTKILAGAMRVKISSIEDGVLKLKTVKDRLTQDEIETMSMTEYQNNYLQVI